MNDPLRGLSGADVSRLLGWVVCVPLYELGRTEPERAEKIRASIQSWARKPLSADAQSFVAQHRAGWEAAALAG